jgi:beta-lactamase regulating signal transducer with metallopeptidase domain
MTTGLPFSGAASLLLFLTKATVLLVAALIATVPLRRGTAGSRHLVWLAALVGVLALPLLSRVDSLRLGVLPSAIAVGGERPVGESSSLTAPPAPRGSSASRASVASTPVAHHAGSRALAPALAGAAPGDLGSVPVLSAIALVWSVVALTLVGWLVIGTVSVRRIVADARELTSPDWTMPLCEVADRLDLESPPRLVISDRTEMAFACRALAPTIVLPAAAESWSDDRRRAVLFHELAHIKRHDLLGHTLGRLACALYWFHPLVWTAAKNLRAESERACDDLVLSCGARPSEYAQHLLEMVTSVRDYGAPIMALPMARKKEFEGRMLAILDPAIRRASPGRVQSATVVATVGVLSLTVAAVAPAAPRFETPQASPIVQGSLPQPSAPPVVPRLGQLSEPRPSSARSEEGPPTPQASQPSQSERASDAPRPTPSAEMAQSGDTTRAAMLVRILQSDPDAHVRRTAAWGLNDIHTLGGRDALIRALRTDSDWEVREMSAWALADYRVDVAQSALVDGLRDKNAKVRAICAWALGNIGSKKDVGELESAASDSDEDVREAAIWAIGQMSVKSAPAIVVNALTDNSERVRLVSAWALGEIADPSSANALVRAFQTETASEVRQAEIRALAEMGKMSQAVLDLALKSSDPELRRRAVAVLAGSGNSSWPWPWPIPRPTP